MRACKTFLPLIILASSSVGCATVGGVQENYVVCAYDTAWQASLDAMKTRGVSAQDKEKGTIETGWVENRLVGRPYGAFGRSLEQDKERARVVVTLKKINDVTQVGVNEIREHWGFRGGAHLFQWIPVEPSEEAIAGVMKLINAKLKERGCSPG
ncbi:MAG: hypothetical protein EPO64_08575 [Nitrospirae bacterium]|nr:MAG: hypothetical protein EPO64_08575 [Nitrospirota bacterium]